MIDYETVFAHCVEKLTEQIRECTSKPCLLDPDGLIDRAVAKAYLKAREAAVVGPIFENLKNENPAEYGYHEFDRDYGRYIWNNGYQWIRGIIERGDFFRFNFC